MSASLSKIHSGYKGIRFVTLIVFININNVVMKKDKHAGQYDENARQPVHHKMNQSETKRANHGNNDRSGETQNKKQDVPEIGDDPNEEKRKMPKMK